MAKRARVQRNGSRKRVRSAPASLTASDKADEVVAFARAIDDVIRRANMHIQERANQRRAPAEVSGRRDRRPVRALARQASGDVRRHKRRDGH